ncbi:hypothetical protein Tco_1345484 [Tanacetum coccineum]
MQEVILFYNGLGIPTRQILDSRGVIQSKTAADAKVRIYQKSQENSQKRASTDTRIRREQKEAKESKPKPENQRPQSNPVNSRASISDMPLSTYLNLGLGELAHTKLTFELADRTMKYPKGISENVLVDHFCLPPVLKIDVYKRKITLRIGEERIIIQKVKPASSLIRGPTSKVLRERMELDLEVRLMGETLVINRSLDPLNGDYIELNDLNEPFELRRTQGDDFMPTIEEGEKNMDAYRDEGMGDVIFGEPFLSEVGIKARRFEGMIIIYNGDESVTYQMAQSHPRFKHHTNEQCNKILPLLKVSDKDTKNGISHPYQKLKGFYKGVLNLGPDYIRDAKTEEWLTRGHISVHEMEW